MEDFPIWFKAAVYGVVGLTVLYLLIQIVRAMITG